MKPTTNLASTRARIAAERERGWIDFYKRNPDLGEITNPLRVRANLEVMESDLARMLLDNHWAAKQADRPVWSDADISEKERVIELTKQALSETVGNEQNG